MGPAAVVWAAGYGVFGLASALTNTPIVQFGPSPAPVALNWLVVAVAVVAGAVVPATLRPWGRRVPRVFLLSVVWGLAVVCAAAAFGLLMQLASVLISQQVDSWASAGNQVLAAVGVVLLVGTARAHQHATSGTCPRCGEKHGARTSWVRPEPSPAPRAVRVAAYVGCAAFLPYIAMKTTWALGGTFAGVTGADMTPGAEQHDAGGLWPVLESVGIDPTALLAALGIFLILGLVRPWGQVFPRWTPFLAGRPVPRWLPLAPALLGAASLAPYGLVGLPYVALGTLGVVPIDRGDFQTLEDMLVVAWCGMVAFCGHGVALAIAARSYFLRTRPRCVPTPAP
nr:hypothetical protein GCM10020241_64250 [Streptoalloteichus tenebrarius]